MSGSEFSEASEHHRGTARPPHVEVPPADDLRIGPNSQGTNSVYGRAPFPSEARTARDSHVSEPRVQRPDAPHVSENAGRAAMKGASETTRPSSDTAFNEAIWGHAQAQKDGVETQRPTKDMVSQREVVEGEIFEGTIEDKRGQAFDKPLSKEQQVLLVGKHPKDMDGSGGEVLKSHMEGWQETAETAEKKGERSPRFEVLAAHFKSGFESSLEKPAPGWYGVRKSYGVEGFLRVLPPNQLAEATARAATEGDPSAFANTFDVVKTVAKTLQTEERDPETNELIEVKPPLASELREGLQYYRDGRYDPEDRNAFPEARWTLSDEQIDKLDLMKNSSIMERNGPARDLATSFLEAAFDPDYPKVARMNNANTDRPTALAPQDPGNRVRITHVGANGDGYQGDNLAKLLAYALPSALGSNTSVGKPNALYMTGIENAPVDAIRRILDKCQQQDIPVIMTASHVTQEMAEVLSGSAVGVSQVTPATAEVLSQMLGEERREFTKSASLSWSTGKTNGEDKGVSANHDTNPDIPTSVSKSGSRNKSSNEGIDISYTTEVDHNARRVSPAEFGLVQRDQMAVFGSGGEHHGLHDTATRAWMTQFPPPDQKPYSEILQHMQDRLRALKAGEGADGHQRPAIRESVLGVAAIESARGAVAERPTAVFTVPSPNGRSSGEYRMPVMSRAGTNRSGLPDVRGLMNGNGQRIYDERALFDLKRGYEKLRHQPYKKDPANFGQYCIQRYVMALRSGELGNVPLMDWIGSVKATGYVNRHLRLGEYNVNDPNFWHEWFRDHPNCANWAEEYTPSTPWYES